MPPKNETIKLPIFTFSPRAPIRRRSTPIPDNPTISSSTALPFIEQHLQPDREALPLPTILRQKHRESPVEHLPLHDALRAGRPPQPGAALAREDPQHRRRRRRDDRAPQAGVRAPAVVDVGGGRAVEVDGEGVGEDGGVERGADEGEEEGGVGRDGGGARAVGDGRRGGRDAEDAGGGGEEAEAGGCFR